MVKFVEFVELRDIRDYDAAIKKTGYGSFHYEMLAVSAISVISMGFQNGYSSYVFPAAQCDLSLTSFELGVLNMAFMIGGIASCFLWGTLADNLGRRKVLYVSYLADGLVTLVCALLPTVTNLLICRFLNGFLIGAPGSIIFTYVAEFQPPKYRTPVVCCCGIFFTLSWLILPLLAYYVLPLQGVTFNVANILFFSPWRLFLIIVAIPELLSCLWIMKMPESPKFYLAKGNNRECLNVLKQMYFRNTGQHPDTFPVKNLMTEGSNQAASNNLACRGKMMRSLEAMGEQMRNLFKGHLLIVTLLTCSIMFANMFGMFGLGLWLPEIFVRFAEFEKIHPNRTATVAELSTLVQVNDEVTCETTFNATVTFNTVVIATSALVFNSVCSILSMKLHFKVIPLVTMLIGGVTSVAIYFLTSSLQNLVAASLFQASMITANMTIGSIAVELFPTKVIGVAFCLIMCSGRVGAVASSFLFGYYMDSHCEIPIFVVGGFATLGGLLCFLVPKRSKEVQKRRPSTTQGIEIAVLSDYDLRR